MRIINALLTLPTPSVHNGEQSSTVQRTTNTHPLEPTQLTLPTLPRLQKRKQPSV